jgi:hypothetical protein
MATISHVADYIVIGPDFELGVDDSKHIPFTLPPGAVLDEAAIIAFVVNPSSRTEDLVYEVQINDHPLRSGSFTGGVTRGLWETFGRDVLRDGDANSIEFRVLSGGLSGIWAGAAPTVKFQEIVLWFQRQVAAAPPQ